MERSNSKRIWELVDIADEITSLNKGTVLTGSLLLVRNQFDIKRDVNDIDILVDEELEPEDLVFPEGSEVLPIERHEEYSVIARIKYKDVKIDFINPVGQKFSENEEELLLGTIEAKIAYINNGTGDVDKHTSDLYNIFKCLLEEALPLRGYYQ